jgi:DNA-directed RNA polymerase specialized sigma subunit
VKKNGNLTLKEVAKRIGVSHVRIKQIQDVALKKINKKIKEDHNY